MNDTERNSATSDSLDAVAEVLGIAGGHMFTSLQMPRGGMPITQYSSTLASCGRCTPA